MWLAIYPNRVPNSNTLTFKAQFVRRDRSRLGIGERGLIHSSDCDIIFIALFFLYTSARDYSKKDKARRLQIEKEKKRVTASQKKVYQLKKDKNKLMRSESAQNNKMKRLMKEISKLKKEKLNDAKKRRQHLHVVDTVQLGDESAGRVICYNIDRYQP